MDYGHTVNSQPKTAEKAISKQNLFYTPDTFTLKDEEKPLSEKFPADRPEIKGELISNDEPQIETPPTPGFSLEKNTDPVPAFFDPFEAEKTIPLGVITSSDNPLRTEKQNPTEVYPDGDHISQATLNLAESIASDFKKPLAPLSSTYAKMQELRSAYLQKIIPKGGE